MSPDPLENPIAVFTDHRLLSAEEEAGLIAVMLAGAHVRTVLPSTPPAAFAATRDQAIRGEQAAQRWCATTMGRSEAERIEDQLDDILATALHTEDVRPT